MQANNEAIPIGHCSSKSKPPGLELLCVIMFFGFECNLAVHMHNARETYASTSLAT